MTKISDELSEIAAGLDSVRLKFDSREVKDPLQRLEDAANEIGKAWSGSWIGYHSRVYYQDFQIPPPGAHFSQEWGMMSYFTDGTTGEWSEIQQDAMQAQVYALAGQPDLTTARALAKQTRDEISDKRIEIASLITTALTQQDDSFLSRLAKEIDDISVPTASNIVNGYRPRGQFISRDSVAVGQGLQPPPHLEVWADVVAIRIPLTVCENLSQIAKKAAAHLGRQNTIWGTVVTWETMCLLGMAAPPFGKT